MGLLDSITSFFTSKPSTVAPSKPAGGDGVAVFGGMLVSNERNPKLGTLSKWKTYDNAIVNASIIASAVMIRSALFGSAKWSVVANPLGDGEWGADLIREGLLEASMPKPWRNVIRRQGMKSLRGVAMHEGIIRKRRDGRIVYGELAHRPAWTVARWNKPSEQEPWVGIEQQTATSRYYIPRERLFYSVEDVVGDTPDGVGSLRYVVELVDTLARYRQLEGIGFDGDLRGMPIGRAPLAKLREDAKSAGVDPEDPAAITSYIKAQVDFLTKILSNHIKQPNQSLLMDSATYVAIDEKGTISSTPQWGFEIIKAEAGAMPELRQAISGVGRDIARVLGVEFLLMGDGEGARAVHEDKTSMFEAASSSTLQDLADDAKRDLATRLVALNGRDPETETPTLVAKFDRGAVEAACRSLQLLAQAGMPLGPQDVHIVNTLHERMDLPPRDELVDPADSMLRGTPDPAKGEVDIAVDDLADETAPDAVAQRALKPSNVTSAGKPTKGAKR